MPLINRLQHQRGLGLIEALIALLVISIGLLGISALQLTGMQQSASAYWHSKAVWISYEMIDRIYANSPAGTTDIFNQYDGIDTDAGPSGDCQSAPCSQAEMIQADAADWAALVDTLPNGRGVITNSATNTLQVSVMWQDSSGESNCTNGEPVGDDYSCYTVTISR